jgi:hypothetical protein
MSYSLYCPDDGPALVIGDGYINVIGLDGASTTIDRLPAALCRAMKVLASRMPATVPHETLRLALCSGYRRRGTHSERDPYHSIVKVQMCKLRKRLAPAGLMVETEWGIGYALRWAGQKNDGAPPQ